MHTVFVKLNILKLISSASKQLGKLRWAEENILYTVLYTSTLEEEKKNRKKEKKRKTRTKACMEQEDTISVGT